MVLLGFVTSSEIQIINRVLFQESMPKNDFVCGDHPTDAISPKCRAISPFQKVRLLYNLKLSVEFKHAVWADDAAMNVAAHSSSIYKYC